MNIIQEIFAILNSKRNVFLIGSSDSGKTWFVQNELIPFLNKNNKVLYFENCDQLSVETIKDVDFIIVDEVEVLQDLHFLETIHPEEKPYFSSGYIAKIKGWFNKLNNVQQPGVFIITREKESIQNFIRNVKTLDWNGMDAETIEFSRFF